jgi:magnesium chelatase family protein
VRSRVIRARERQIERQGTTNAALTPKQIEAHCEADAAAAGLLKQAIARLRLSPRAYHRSLKLARTIADLAGATTIGAAHVAEAIQYRRAAG